MNPYIVGVVLAAIIGAFVFGYHQGGATTRAKEATDHATQLSALATAWQNRELQTEKKEAAHDAETVNDNALAAASYPDVRMCHYKPITTTNMPATTNIDHGFASAGVLPTTRQGDLVQSEPIGPELHKLLAYADSVVSDCRRDLPDPR